MIEASSVRFSLYARSKIVVNLFFNQTFFTLFLFTKRKPVLKEKFLAKVFTGGKKVVCGLKPTDRSGWMR